MGPCQLLAGAPFEKRAELSATGGMPRLAESLRFDLTDAVPRDGETLADFLECVLAAVTDAEPHFDHLFLAGRERLEHRLGLLLQVQVDHRFGGRHDLATLDEIAKM